ncbi:hypothetical protein CRG98_035446, partial [Punica granatum]
MEVLSVCSPSTLLPLKPSTTKPFSSPPPSVQLRPKASLPPLPSLRTSLEPSRALGFAPSPAFDSALSTAPQSPATAMRGAEADAMGLLLKERIVFLGSSIDDFVADAIISQLLLLDAQDSTKDIRLFINSPGGSL